MHNKLSICMQRYIWKKSDFGESFIFQHVYFFHQILCHHRFYILVLLFSLTSRYSTFLVLVVLNIVDLLVFRKIYVWVSSMVMNILFILFLIKIYLILLKKSSFHFERPLQSKNIFKVLNSSETYL